MAVKIRLQRFGKKKQPVYRVVVMDGRKPRDGRYLEAIGRYEPRQDPSVIEIDNDRALDWLLKGAQPTETAQKLLEISGAWARFKVAKGEIYTVGVQAAPSVEEVEADPEVAEAPLEAVEVVEEVAAEAEATSETEKTSSKSQAEAGEESE